MTVLVTGAAGFIGMHVAKALIARGERVIGVDDLNPYYAVALKRARLAELGSGAGFRFSPCDIADRDALGAALGGERINRIVHLAAQAGVRYSLENPMAYVHANVAGHVTVLELARHLGTVDHIVYASSSSVYGGNTKLPFSENDPVDTPVSLYAATKKADELISHTYSHLYGLAQTGLRFFTVYGPWGRPDMAYWSFTEAILAGRPIQVNNDGDMKRDFTYIDDIVQGVLAALDHPPKGQSRRGRETEPPHRVYNLGNNRPEPLLRLIELIEEGVGKRAEKRFAPMQLGDVKETYADIRAIQRDLGFTPTTPLDVGLPRFIEWYRAYHGV